MGGRTLQVNQQARHIYLQDPLKHTWRAGAQQAHHTLRLGQSRGATRMETGPGAAQRLWAPGTELLALSTCLQERRRMGGLPAQAWARFTWTNAPVGLKGLGEEGDPNTQSDLDRPEKEISTFCSYFKLKVAALFQTFTERFSVDMTETLLSILCGQNHNVLEEMSGSNIIFRQKEADYF